MKIQKKKPMLGELTAREKIFVQEYLKDFDGASALERAGVKCKTKGSYYSLSHEWLKSDHIKSALSNAVNERCKRIEVTVDGIIKELHKIATSDIGEAFQDSNTLMDIHKMPEHVRKAISSIEVLEEYTGTGEQRVWTGYTRKVKFWEKTKALELLGKHLQMWIDKLQLTGDINLIYGHRKPKE